MGEGRGERGEGRGERGEGRGEERVEERGYESASSPFLGALRSCIHEGLDEFV